MDSREGKYRVTLGTPEEERKLKVQSAKFKNHRNSAFSHAPAPLIGGDLLLGIALRVGQREPGVWHGELFWGAWSWVLGVFFRGPVCAVRRPGERDGIA